MNSKEGITTGENMPRRVMLGSREHERRLAAIITGFLSKENKESIYRAEKKPDHEVIKQFREAIIPNNIGELYELKWLLEPSGPVSILMLAMRNERLVMVTREQMSYCLTDKKLNREMFEKIALLLTEGDKKEYREFMKNQRKEGSGTSPRQKSDELHRILESSRKALAEGREEEALGIINELEDEEQKKNWLKITKMRIDLTKLVNRATTKSPEEEATAKSRKKEATALMEVPSGRHALVEMPQLSAKIKGVREIGFMHPAVLDKMMRDLQKFLPKLEPEKKEELQSLAEYIETFFKIKQENFTDREKRIIREIFKYMKREVDQKKRKQSLKVGAYVQILAGPYKGENAKVVEVDSKNNMVRVKPEDSTVFLPIILSFESIYVL